MSRKKTIPSFGTNNNRLSTSNYAASILRGVLATISVSLTLLGQLIFIPAPNYQLWKVALLACEFAPLFALSSLAFGLAWFAFGRSSGKLYWFVTALFAVDTLLFGLPTGVAIAQAQATGVPIDLLAALFGKQIPTVETRINQSFTTADGLPLALDLYLPLNQPITKDLRPAVVVIHGGGWAAGHRSDLADANKMLAARGYLVADISYRLADSNNRFPNQGNDVDAAINWLTKHAHSLRINPSRIGILGRSAGGQLALWEAYNFPDKIHAVASFYAPTDLIWGYHNVPDPDIIGNQHLLRNYIGGTPQSEREAYNQASPINLVKANSPATLLIHGSTDQMVSPKHAQFLATRLANHHVPHELVSINLANHGFDFNPNSLHGQIAWFHINKFLDRFLTNQPRCQ